MKDQVVDILKRNHLSVTDSRKVILDLFLQHSHGALRHSDIEKTLNSLDRVTIYRTLQVFANKGIIHSIPNSEGAASYALCTSGCQEGHHHDDHVHFICTVCRETTCLENVHIPRMSLPAGYEIHKVEMVITGVCKKCRT